jgi:hypothetical protein
MSDEKRSGVSFTMVAIGALASAGIAAKGGFFGGPIPWEQPKPSDRRSPKRRRGGRNEEDLHARIADALGWSESEVHSHSLQGLRELVRPIDAELAQEITDRIVSGDGIRGKAVERTRGSRISDGRNP